MDKNFIKKYIGLITFLLSVVNYDIDLNKEISFENSYDLSMNETLEFENNNRLSR